MNNRPVTSVVFALSRIPVICLLLLAACEQAPPDASYDTIQIHAGSSGGAYEQLVALLDQRLPCNSDSTIGQEGEKTACLKDVTIKAACSNGGSVKNLERLGMTRQDQKPSSAGDCDFDETNQFALVQNFFVYGAAEENCIDRNSPDCRSQAAKKDLKDYSYFAGLRAVLPMYYGRIQLVTRQSPEQTAIRKMPELSGRPIYVGNGVNKTHGEELLSRHPKLTGGLAKNMLGRDEAISRLTDKTGLDKSTVPTGQRDLGNLLLACGIVDAYVISGELITESPAELAVKPAKGCEISLVPKQIPVPEVIIKGMTEDHPYYQKVAAPESLVDTGFKHDMPAVTTYLVTTAGTSTSIVRQLTTALHAEWRNLMLLNPNLVRLEENIYKQPAPLHPGAEQALQNAGLLGRDPLRWYYAVFGILAFIGVLLSTEVSYDRLGEKQAGSSGRHFSRLVLILIGTTMFFVLVVKLIRTLEGTQAFGAGTDNPIAHKGFEEVLLWMFTFVSSGYENNVFPSSPWSIFVVGLFAIFGIALPIWAIVKVIDHMRESKLARARGGEHRGWLKRRLDQFADWTRLGHRSHGVLLLCGWNNKAPGLIFSLTCPDSPYPGVVNIVADMEVEYPIQHWHFNKHRVRFYRGDPSHRATLMRAEGLRADNALILADYHTGSSANTAGVLTALALKKLQKKGNDKPLFIAAEMTVKDNDLQFSQNHVNDIIDPRLITRRMLSIACYNEHVLSFVLDALSPDDHCEWYSIEAETLRKRFLRDIKNPVVGDYWRRLQQHGILVTGICSEGSVAGGSSFSPDFNKNLNLNPLIHHEDLELPVPDESYIVCAAKNPGSLRRARLSNLFVRPLPVPGTKVSPASILPAIPTNARILVIGHQQQSASLSQHLEVAYPGSETAIVATDQIDDSDVAEAITSSIEGNDWRRIILLSSMPESYGGKEYYRNSRQADSDTILKANLIQNALDKKGSDALIIAEVNNTHSRRLAEDAGVDAVVPSSLLVERILARLVSGRGHVSELLLAMLSLQDGIYLRSFEVRTGDALDGEKFGDLVNTWYSDGRVVGFLPQDLLATYRNESDDFATHFAMVPFDDTRSQRLKAGDVVIVLGFPERQ